MYKVYKPQNDILKKYIDDIYILEKFEGQKSYYAFPYLGNILGLFNNTSIKFDDSKILLKPLKSEPKVVLTGKYMKPIYLHYEKYVNELSINFNLTGLNYFFEKNTPKLAPNTFQFINDEKWLQLANKLCSIKNNDEKFEVVESFLLKSIVAKKIPNIQDCVLLLQKNPDYFIKNIAEKFEISTKTINRWFKNYTNFSPNEVKRIIRFRNAIKTKQVHSDLTLTKICYDSGFYDSSYFTNEFKKLTSLSPKDFFKNLDAKTLEKLDIPFQFE